jgi:hypothetical protein
MVAPGRTQGGEFELLFGDAAQHFPGPEILQDFTPAEHIIPEAAIRQNIANIPGEPGLLLRWSPACLRRSKWIADQGYTRLEDAARDTCEQHLLLSDNGIAVPPYRLFMGTGPANTFAEGLRVTYAVVPRIAEPPLESMRDIRGIPVVSGLARYLCSPARIKTGRLARDIYTPGQYLGTNLSDIEPAVSTETTGSDKQALIHSGHSVLTWANRVGAYKDRDVTAMGAMLGLYR